MESIRGRPPNSDERARKDGGKHRDAQEPEVRIQQTEGKEMGGGNDGRTEIVCELEFESTDEGCNEWWKKREKGTSIREKGKVRRRNQMRRQKSRNGMESPARLLNLSYATRSN